MTDAPRHQDVLKEEGPNPVNRGRRASFVFSTCTSAIGISAALAFGGYDTAVSKLVADKLLDIAQVLAVVYVSASAFDYSVGSGVKFAFKNRNMTVKSDD